MATGLAGSVDQPLTEAQTKAIESSSKMPTAAKVFLFASLGAVVVLTAWGLYRFNNPP